MSLKSLRTGRAPPTTRPVSLRLALRDIEQLQARAVIVSGTATGIARELILTGLAGGDNKALADRLMLIERRLVILEATVRDLCAIAYGHVGKNWQDHVISVPRFAFASISTLYSPPPSDSQRTP